MTKKFILNLLINLGIVFLILSIVSGYKSGNMLFLGLAIAFLVVLIYLKVVLLKQVNREMVQKKAEAMKQMSKQKKRAKKQP